MNPNRRPLTYGLFAAALLLVAVAAGAMPHPQAPPPPQPPPQIVAVPVAVPPAPPLPPAPPPVVQPEPPKANPPKIDVVFALDTTGSMDGLIDGAKRKIWSIATYLQQAQPKPEVRIGLVGYRDIGDAYVTRFYDLSSDMDVVFKHLSAFRAEGGGDTPEHVARALHDAVERSSWSTGGAGEGVVKIIYLVGDAPPHTDYQDGFDFRAIARKAGRMGIHLNTILCGTDHDARVAWLDIARAGHGEFASIAQSGGVAVVHTPYDDKMAALNRRLAGTALGYGAHKAEVAEKAHAAASIADPLAGADRAAYAGSAGVAVSGEGDLISDMASGKASMGHLRASAPSAMPDSMRSMSPEEQNAFVGKKKAEREAVITEIKSLATKRDAYMKSAAPAGRAAGFDDEVRRSVAKDAKGVLSF